VKIRLDSWRGAICAAKITDEIIARCCYFLVAFDNDDPYALA